MAEKRVHSGGDWRGHRQDSKRVKSSSGRGGRDVRDARGRDDLPRQETGRWNPESTKALNEKRPKTVNFMAPPEYVPSQQIQHQEGLPPLPKVKDPSIEEAVFTHTSTLKQNQSDSLSYERLEFLGDAHLEVIATRIIYSRFPQMDVGRQSQLRESLVRNDTLSKFSEGYGFDKRLRYNISNKDPKTWQKIMGDVFEAYVAAVIITDPVEGFDVVEEWLTNLWADTLLYSKAANPSQYGDSRVQLQVHLVSPGVRLLYKEEKPHQIDRSRGLYTFYYGVYLKGWGYENEWLGSGEGKSVAEAKDAAAADALKRDSEIMRKAHVSKAVADEERKRLREEKERLKKETAEEETAEKAVDG